MAFPINVMAFPINGMAPGLAAAPGHGQVALGARPRALGPGTLEPCLKTRGLTKDLLVNLKKLGFSQKLVFSRF